MSRSGRLETPQVRRPSPGSARHDLLQSEIPVVYSGLRHSHSLATCVQTYGSAVRGATPEIPCASPARPAIRAPLAATASPRFPTTVLMRRGSFDQHHRPPPE